MASLLQQKSEKKPSTSAWRFVKLAFKLHAPEPSFRHVLLCLSAYANDEGKCFPSHKLLLDDTGYKTKTTIVDALAHWKDKGILTWTKGWGNAYGKRANTYQFHEDAMRFVIEEQGTEGSNDEQPLDPENEGDEKPLSADEQPLSSDEQPLDPRGKTTQPHTKVLYSERPSPRTSQPLNGAGASFTDTDSGTQSSGSASPMYEKPISGDSYEKPISGSSSEPFPESGRVKPMAELLEELGKDRTWALYNRTSGNYGRDDVEAELRALRAEQESAVTA